VNSFGIKDVEDIVLWKVGNVYADLPRRETLDGIKTYPMESFVSGTV
jgi:hypothetical protein